MPSLFSRRKLGRIGSPVQDQAAAEAPQPICKPLQATIGPTQLRSVIRKSPPNHTRSSHTLDGIVEKPYWMIASSSSAPATTLSSSPIASEALTSFPFNLIPPSPTPSSCSTMTTGTIMTQTTPSPPKLPGLWITIPPAPILRTTSNDSSINSSPGDLITPKASTSRQLFELPSPSRESFDAISILSDGSSFSWDEPCSPKWSEVAQRQSICSIFSAVSEVRPVTEAELDIGEGEDSGLTTGFEEMCGASFLTVENTPVSPPSQFSSSRSNTPRLLPLAISPKRMSSPLSPIRPNVSLEANGGLDPRPSDLPIRRTARNLSHSPSSPPTLSCQKQNTMNLFKPLVTTPDSEASLAQECSRSGQRRLSVVEEGSPRFASAIL